MKPTTRQPTHTAESMTTSASGPPPVPVRCTSAGRRPGAVGRHRPGPRVRQSCIRAPAAADDGPDRNDPAGPYLRPAGLAGGHLDRPGWRLADTVNNPTRNRLAMEAYLDLAAGKRALAFAVDVQHVRDLAQ